MGLCNGKSKKIKETSENAPTSASNGNGNGNGMPTSKKCKRKHRQQTKHVPISLLPECPTSPDCDPPQIVLPTPDSSVDSGNPPSRDSQTPRSVGTSESSHELENVLTAQIRTLEREKRDLTADLSTLNVGPAGSEDDNFSADDLDGSSVDDLDTVIHTESVTFDTPASPSKLNHLNKHRAPKQKKRPPARYSMLLLEGESLEEGLGGEGGSKKGFSLLSQGVEARKEEQPPVAQDKIKKKRGSKEKKKKKGKYNKKSDAKLDDSVVEV